MLPVEAGVPFSLQIAAKQGCFYNNLVQNRGCIDNGLAKPEIGYEALLREISSRDA